jgi:hypothetical protein
MNFAAIETGPLIDFNVNKLKTDLSDWRRDAWPSCSSRPSWFNFALIAP